MVIFSLVLTEYTKLLHKKLPNYLQTSKAKTIERASDCAWERECCAHEQQCRATKNA